MQTLVPLTEPSSPLMPNAFNSQLPAGFVAPIQTQEPMSTTPTEQYPNLAQTNQLASVYTPQAQASEAEQSVDPITSSIQSFLQQTAPRQQEAPQEEESEEPAIEGDDGSPISFNGGLNASNVSYNALKYDGPVDLDRVAYAIGQYESGGRYNALGPVLPSGSYKGDRAYGKYQVMGKNIPSWTKKALGVSMTPQQYLADTKAQDATAKYYMAQNLAKYGNVEDVASIWLSGRPASNNRAKDLATGVSVPSYIKNVMAYYNRYNPEKDGMGGPGPMGMGQPMQNSQPMPPAPQSMPAGPSMPAPQAPQQQPPAPPTQQFQNLGKVTVPFGGQTAWESKHPGVDIANKTGTPVPSMSDGVVTSVVEGKGQADPNNPNDPNHGFGNQVAIRDPYGNEHRYSHLHNSYVKVGQRLSKGDTIGPMGASGSSYSPSGGDASHLDYRLIDAYGRYMNPNRSLQAR